MIAMKPKRYSVVILLLLTLFANAEQTPGEHYKMANEPSGERYDWKETGQPERPWLIPYDQTLVTKIFLCRKDPKGGPQKVYLTFEQALEVIQKLDNLTCGIPKIVYLVGWQFDGHDSKYPSWSEVNRHLKRPQDKTAVQSLRWLMREARKYNTIVSLHINMIDAYPDSPLWDTYVEHDIIYKNKDGSILWGRRWGGQRSAPISYYQEWKLGFAQKRIDDLLAMLPELIESKTIHIDAFHTVDAKSKVVSPYLGHYIEREAETQRKIFRYFRDKGIDVTAEFGPNHRTDEFAGLQPFAWHLKGKYPPHIYSGSPMKAESEIKQDPENLSGLLDQFCLEAVPWHYNNNKTNQKGQKKTREGDDIFMPALWKREKTLIAYSADVYPEKTWELPPDWDDVDDVSLYAITLDGLKPLRNISVSNQKLNLSLKQGEALLITPKKAN